MNALVPSDSVRRQAGQDMVPPNVDSEGRCRNGTTGGKGDLGSGRLEFSGEPLRLDPAQMAEVPIAQEKAVIHTTRRELDARAPRTALACDQIVDGSNGRAVPITGNKPGSSQSWHSNGLDSDAGHRAA